MPTKIIELEEGIRVEVEAAEGEIVECAGGISEKVTASIDQIQDLLSRVIRPVVNTWGELNREVEMAQAEVEVGFKFEGKGNLVLAEATAGTHLTVKLTLKPPEARRRRRMTADG